MTRLIILRLLESYFRHRWLNLAPIVLMMAAAVTYVAIRPRDYITQALVYVPGQSYLATLTAVRNDPGFWYVSPAQGTTNQLRELLRTDTFVRSVVAKTHLEPDFPTQPSEARALLRDVREAIWVVPQSDTQILLGTRHAQPLIAYELAVATIENYTQWRIDAEVSQSAAAQTFFAELLETYEADVIATRQALAEYLTEHPEPLSGPRATLEQVEIARLTAEIQQAEARYNTVIDKDESARLAASQAEVNARQAFYVMDPPKIPDEPAISLRQTAIQAGLFVAVGVMLSVVMIVGGALLDRTFVLPLDVRQELQLPVIGVLPDVTPRRRWWFLRLRRRRRPDEAAPSQPASNGAAHPRKGLPGRQSAGEGLAVTLALQQPPARPERESVQA